MASAVVSTIGVSPRLPMCARVVIGTYVSSIAEIDVGAFSLSHRLDFRVFLLEPLLHQSLVAFDRTLQRLLAGDAKLRQETPTELALNFMPNLSLMSLATISRVHSANSNFSCNGFFWVTVV